MKKPDTAGADWYEDPEDKNLERFWNGKYWEKDTRVIGEEVEGPLAIGEYHLGLLLFRSPILRDNAFKTFAVICIFSFISGIYREIELGTRAKIIPLFMLGVVPLMTIYIYVLFLPYLIFRRRKDKKRAITADSTRQQTPSRRRVLIISLVVVAALGFFYFIGGGASTKNSKIESFLQHQQEITEVLRRYNSEAGAAVGVVRGISDGTLSAGDGISQFAVAGSKVTPLLRDLQVACEAVPFPRAEGSIEELAIAKAFNMLKVVCAVTPKQFLKLQQIFQAQISDEVTQAQLDQLSMELERLNQEKIAAAIDGIDAVLPFANETESSLLKALKEAFISR